MDEIILYLEVNEMDKVVFYERGMNEIQGRYDLVKRLIVEC